MWTFIAFGEQSNLIWGPDKNVWINRTNLQEPLVNDRVKRDTKAFSFLWPYSSPIVVDVYVDEHGAQTTKAWKRGQLVGVQRIFQVVHIQIDELE